MRHYHIHTVYFSPTGGTAGIANAVASRLQGLIGDGERKTIDLTSPAVRGQEYHFGPEDLVVVASPVYAGRLPNKIAPDYAACLHADGALSVPICVFGNRSPGDAVRELAFLLEQNGFVTAGAAAMVCRHAFTDEVGTGRPDDLDAQCQQAFAEEIVARLAAAGSDTPQLLPMDRETPIAPYYTPLRVDGAPARFLKAKSVRTEDCIQCGHCAPLCPMGSIDAVTGETTGICIKCQACVRGCPVGARVITDPDFLSHVEMLRQNYTRRAENQLIPGT